MFFGKCTEKQTFAIRVEPISVLDQNIVNQKRNKFFRLLRLTRAANVYYDSYEIAKKYYFLLGFDVYFRRINDRLEFRAVIRLQRLFVFMCVF